METNLPSTSITLDKWHKKTDETFPLKLRVIFERKVMYYAISIELANKTKIDSLTPENLKEAKAEKPKKAFKEIGLLLASKETFASDILKELNENFTFEAFKERFTGITKASDPDNVFYWYDLKIKELESNDQLGTANSYGLSLKSLKAFIKYTSKKENTKLNFKDITVKWLQKYDSYMISDKTTLLPNGEMKTKEGNSRTTVGIYLRPLRAMFKKAIKSAIKANNVPPVYPFGSDVDEYTIPKGQRVKKALTKEQLNLLFNADLLTPEQAKARDYWFFSYTCNGMNTKDIAMLRNKDVKTDSLSFYRAKTMRTNADPPLVNVMLTDFAKSIIEKYRNPDTNPKAFLFGILNHTDNAEVQRNKVQSFTRFINQHVKKIAVSVGITHDISTYFARHSFATLAIQGGASIEYVSEALSHSDIKTTRGYFAGFEDTTKKEILEGLMDF